MEPPDGGGARARGNGVMGQKVNPIGLRLGINRTWDSRWFADDSYADLLHEDLRIRKYLRGRLQQAGVSRIVIERPAKKARITIHTARPGVVRSEEHTSELQSLMRISYAVFCLKKKHIKIIQHTYNF